MTGSPLPAAPSRTLPRRRRSRAALVTLVMLSLPLLLLATCQPPSGAELQFAAAAPADRGIDRPPAAGPARFAGGEFIADDGARLPLRKWLPSGPVKAVVLALHGFGDYSHAFEMPAKTWAERGIATFAYDQRGFGAAPGRGRWAGAGRLAVDAIVATRILRQAYPGRPLYLLGESMGGAVAILAGGGAMRGLLADPDAAPSADIDGLVLSAPAVWGRTTMDLGPRLALFVAARLFPEMSMTGQGLGIRASDNLEMLRALSRDPMTLKGARVDTIYGLVDLMDDALAAAPAIERPLLLLYGAHDQVIPRRPMEEFVAHLPTQPKTPRRLAYYRDGYHLLLRDLDGADVSEDVAGWIFDPAVPLRSGADASAAARRWPPAEAVAEVPARTAEAP